MNIEVAKSHITVGTNELFESDDEKVHEIATQICELLDSLDGVKSVADSYAD